MIVRVVLNFDVPEDAARFWGLGACCWILMILNMMPDFDDFEDSAGF